MTEAKVRMCVSKSVVATFIYTNKELVKLSELSCFALCVHTLHAYERCIYTLYTAIKHTTNLKLSCVKRRKPSQQTEGNKRPRIGNNDTHAYCCFVWTLKTHHVHMYCTTIGVSPSEEPSHSHSHSPLFFFLFFSLYIRFAQFTRCQCEYLRCLHFGSVCVLCVWFWEQLRFKLLCMRTVLYALCGGRILCVWIVLRSICAAYILPTNQNISWPSKHCVRLHSPHLHHVLSLLSLTSPRARPPLLVPSLALFCVVHT